MSETQNQKKIYGLYGLIILLLIVVLIQTGLLISRSKNKTKPVTAQSHESKPFPQGHPKVPFHSSAAAGLWGQESYDPFFAEFMPMMQRMHRLANAVMTNLPNTGVYDYMPALDLEEKDNAYLVIVDLPGLEKDKININVRSQVLTIQGIRQTSSKSTDDQQGFYSQERSYGSFARSITLPGPVDESAVKAQYDNGVLTITLPKLAGDKSTQKISVQ